MGALLERGGRATLRSTIPPLTPAAWASFYTGTNPGKHGVVDFFTRIPGTYKLAPVNATRVKGEPLWKIAGNQGKRVCVYNVPMTYPAAPVNGIMISGMDSPRLDEKAVYPLEFQRELQRAVPGFSIEPRVDIKYLIKNSNDPVDEYIARLRAYMETELKTIRFLMDHEDWDLFIAVIRSIDILQHVFWRSAENVISDGGKASAKERRRAEAIFACYERLDRELGERWSGWARDRNLIFMSDHGFGRLEGEVCLNRILAEAGLLRFRQKGARRRVKEFVYNRVTPLIPPAARWRMKRYLRKDYETGRAVVLYVDALVADIDWSDTQIYSLAQFGCMYVNLKGREPMGIVDGEEERRQVLSRAKEALSRFRNPADEEPLITEFNMKEDLFQGPLEPEMPDMVISMRNHAYRGVYSTYSELSGTGLVRSVYPERRELAHTGNHRLEGILVMGGPDIQGSDLGEVRIIDVAPTALNLLGLAVPEGWDGEILASAMTGGAPRPIAGDSYERAVGESEPEQAEEVLTEEDEEEVRKRLQDLGYL